MVKGNPNTMIAKIKVVGVGGGGGNAVSRMKENFTRGVEFWAINTDQQDLEKCEVKNRILIGKNITKGLGAGMNPDLGRQAAEESRSEIGEALKGADLLFITGGFGGGTATGAVPVLAEIAKQAGILTVAVITKPFSFEGTQRGRIAEEGFNKIKDKVDGLIVVPNDRVFTIISKETPILKAFESIDNILKNALQGIVDLLVNQGIINLDFADMKAVIQDGGLALIGMGVASGKERALNAVNQALNPPLLELSAEGAKGVVLAISGGKDLKMDEVNEAAKKVAQVVDPGAKIIFGTYADRKLKPGQIKITLVATGFGNSLPMASLFSSNVIQGKPYFGVSKFGKEEESEEESGGGAQGPLKENLAAGKTNPNKIPPEPKKNDESLWDIPAFLRKRKKW
jgi:cell division protein FtsZ